jgi:putative ABC transport system permease protein
LKSYRQLIPIYLKSQKRRTFSVGTAIFLATTLIICMMVLGKSHNRNAIAAAEYSNGKEHAILLNLNKAELQKLKKEKEIGEVAVRENIGYGVLKNGTGINIEGFDKKSITLGEYAISKGKFPNKQGEIAIEKWMLSNLKLKAKCGQIITFDVKSSYTENADKMSIHKMKMKFKLVGILKDNHLSKLKGSSAITVFGAGDKILPAKYAQYNSYIKLKSYIGMFNRINKLSKKYASKRVIMKPNTNLLIEYDILDPNSGSDITGWNESFKVFFLQNMPVIIAVLMIIYNIFNISILNRMTEFGIMRSVGAKPAQIRKLIFGEALYISIFAIPLGIFTGLGVAKAFSVIGAENMNVGVDIAAKLYIPVGTCLMGIILIIVAVFIAVIPPAYKAGKISPMEAIRGEKSNIKEKNIKTDALYSFSMKHFGISFNIAFQNIWRNRKRFIVTVLCMCVCGTLYLTERNEQHTRDVYGEKIYKRLKVTMPFIKTSSDYQMETFPCNPKSIKTGYSEENVSKMSKFKGIDKIEVSRRDWNSKIVMDKSMVIPEYGKSQETAQWYKEDIKNKLLSSDIIGFKAKELIKNKCFLTSGSVNVKAMKAEPVVLLVNQVYDPAADKSTTITKYKAGDTIKVKIPVKCGKAYTDKIYNCKVGGILNGKWFFSGGNDRYATPIVIFHEDMFKKLTNSSLYQEIEIKINKGMGKRDVKKLGFKLMKMGLSISNGYFKDSTAEWEKDHSFQAQEDMINMGILLSLIIIAIVNIFNTMATNLIMRSKEFGLFKIVGITMRQLKNMVVIEVIVYAVTSAIFAFAAASILGYWRLQDEFKYSLGMKYHVSITGILIVFCAYLVFSLLAAILPLKRVIKSNAIESIRSVE